MNTEYCKSGSSLLVSEVRRPFSSAHSRTCLASVADLYAAVSRAAPGIPWRESLDMPLAAATHLAAASHRANGGKTERPMDWASALEQMVDFRESDESGNKLLQQCGQSDTEQR